MPKPLFTDHDKQYLARFLGGELPHPLNAFEARAYLERAAAATNPQDPQERMVRATFIEWANEIDPPAAPASSAHH